MVTGRVKPCERSDADPPLSTRIYLCPWASNVRRNSSSAGFRDQARSQVNRSANLYTRQRTCRQKLAQRRLPRADKVHAICFQVARFPPRWQNHNRWAESTNRAPGRPEAG